jgi:hypothetical protein
MTTYNDILNQIKTLNDKEQNRLFEKLKKRLNALSQDKFSEQNLAEYESE